MSATVGVLICVTTIPAAANAAVAIAYWVASEAVGSTIQLVINLSASPSIGWSAGLAEKGIGVVLDDLGRLSVARGDARRLFAEKQAAEQKAREMAAAYEQQAIERDRQWRASMPRGAAWYEVPPGVLPVVAMTEAAKDAQPRRRSVLEDALAGGETVMHILEPQPAFLEDE